MVVAVPSVSVLSTTSVGKILSTSTRPIFLKKMKIVPFQDAALGFLNSPDATRFSENFNKDVEIENEKILQMDNFL
ncbi:hypothetical protein TrLO_g616 [Triparma laevis f. longispina]|uniref:Uncharacterized protein n=1 Tax=Triparma laevis f. longispina TaxID=1714387 RepID=A0A9W7F803_9STRA|nr:hypothetical protein TrLO_g616 [Triparma laevis f. longispina]